MTSILRENINNPLGAGSTPSTGREKNYTLRRPDTRFHICIYTGPQL
jgi:hypothetical protein